MKLLVCCLLAITCCVLANVDKVKRTMKLTEVLKELRELNKSVAHNGMMLNTPTLDIEECCFLSALECFRKMVPSLKAKQKKLQRKVIKNLSPLTFGGVDSCSREERENKVCQGCDSYPMKDSREFVKKLESLLQKPQPCNRSHTKASCVHPEWSIGCHSGPLQQLHSFGGSFTRVD
ncbi:interleukin-21 [Oncorhynchus kisutch]|uniref:interleukin-21 n=1 Tax=Oncorhynchus kisutch TaxID=8019 RepID=UPI0012DCDA7B|nr:interleukin-21 [Oncorhynchus kisutch]